LSANKISKKVFVSFFKKKTFFFEKRSKKLLSI